MPLLLGTRYYLSILLSIVILIYYIFHISDSSYIVGLCMSVHINCIIIIVNNMIIVVTVKNYHHNHHHIACRVLGLVTSFDPIKSREVIGEVVLGFVSHMVDIS